MVCVGDVDIDRSLLSKVQLFLLEQTHLGKCSLEHDRTTFHLHFAYGHLPTIKVPCGNFPLAQVILGVGYFLAPRRPGDV